MIGETIGPYRITAKLGAGGMGEVYRAHDPRLGRDVAIKVSAAQFSERFEREARAVAALNHPNICHLYDVGPNYLVMELVEGESPKGPLPVDEALAIAWQIADALEAAHEKGITHRDLKPANIKVKSDGTVKVLDFGLAKVAAASTSDGENSPTLTLGATVAGMILGTPGYMSPEQTRGKPVDKRADIWSFGVVLYELLTGERMFEGDDAVDTLAQVRTRQPDLERVPPQVRKLLGRCLEKDPKQRLRDIGDARDLVAQPALPAVSPSRLGWVGAAAMALAALGLGLIHFRETPPPLEAVQFALEASLDTSFTYPYGGYAPSPDGRYVVFSVVSKTPGPTLWLRPLDSLAARQLPGTESGNFPTWSPNSKSLAFSANGKLKRIEISGGSPLTLSDAAPNDAVSPTGTWNRDGVILFGSSAGLKRVSESGGSTTLLTKADPARKETGHGYPQFLPDGDRFLFFVASDDPNVQGVYASSLRNPGQRRLILRTDTKAFYVPPRAPYPGYLLWMQDQTLLAQRFDAASLQPEGNPVSVAEGIGRLPPVPIRAAFWASDAGTLIYFANALLGRPLVWMSREGKQLGEAAPADNFLSIALAPGAKSVAVTRTGPSSGQSNIDVWVRELDRGVMNRLTSDPANDANPVWSPDGKWIAFSSNREGGVFQIYRKDASSAGQEERLTEGPLRKIVLDWSRDGGYILYGEQSSATTSGNIMALPLEGSRKPILVVQGAAPQSSAAISPDGRWVAYGSTLSGSFEIYVQAFPAAASWANAAPQGHTQISIAGGGTPKWRGDGKELYFRTGTALMVAAIQELPQGIRAETPRELFRPGETFSYDVTPDGQRFLVMLTTAGQQVQKLTVVSHWQAALRR
jgi:serine/threonine protein kinase